jgi:hypothetical protein
MTPRAPDRRSSAWRVVLSTLLVVGVFAVVVVTWVQDDPDSPLDERLDVFLLLVLFVGVVAYAVDGAPAPLSRAVRRSWLGWSMAISSLVGRRRK